MKIISMTPSRELKAKLYPSDPEWKDIDTVYSSFGQGEDVLYSHRAVAGAFSHRHGGQNVCAAPDERDREIAASGRTQYPRLIGPRGRPELSSTLSQKTFPYPKTRAILSSKACGQWSMKRATATE